MGSRALCPLPLPRPQGAGEQRRTPPLLALPLCSSRRPHLVPGAPRSLLRRLLHFPKCHLLLCRYILCSRWKVEKRRRKGCWPGARRRGQAVPGPSRRPACLWSAPAPPEGPVCRASPGCLTGACGHRLGEHWQAVHRCGLHPPRPAASRRAAFPGETVVRREGPRLVPES